MLLEEEVLVVIRKFSSGNFLDKLWYKLMAALVSPTEDAWIHMGLLNSFLENRPNRCLMKEIPLFLLIASIKTLLIRYGEMRYSIKLYIIIYLNVVTILTFYL
jgi:hypothetical protein